MVPIEINGASLYGVVAGDGVGLRVRVRVSVDEYDQLGLVPGRQVRVKTPAHAGTFLLTTADETPPFAFLRLMPLASRAAG